MPGWVGKGGGGGAGSHWPAEPSSGWDDLASGDALPADRWHSEDAKGLGSMGVVSWGLPSLGP